MQRFDLMSWLHQLLATSNGMVLWVSLALLFLTVALWAQRRSVLARARADRARREAEQGDLGGDSYFMPLPVIEQAVEIANPVEIDSLLEGESEAVAARAREMLSAPTGVSTDFDDLPAALTNALSPPPPPPPPVEAPRALRPESAIPPTIAIPLPRAMADLQAQMAASRPGAEVSAASAASATAAAARSAATAAALSPVALPVQPPPPPPPPADDISRIPVRDLVLTWFEARGYRAKAVSVRFRPVELELRHHSDPNRNYAFVVEREKVTAQRSAALLKQAKASGLSRLLIAAEAGVDPFSQREMRRMGVRAFDRNSIRAEIESVDLRIAAKIIGVARGRNQARKSQAAAAGGPTTLPGPSTVPGKRTTEAPANV